MSRFNDSLEERQKAARAAKQAMLERFAARPKHDDPAMVEKRAARQDVLAAREARRIENEKKQEEARAERVQQERAEAALREQAEQERQRDAETAIAREAELKASQKAARDARYAARKARK